jgi:hypothetical protein
MKKKLQVFVSSTYEDLKVDRQAAVSAILKAGHIPAGMELLHLVINHKWKLYVGGSMSLMSTCLF